MTEHLLPLPTNEEPLPYTPTQHIAAACRAIFGLHPDAKMQVRAGQVVALQGMLEAVRKLLALAELPPSENEAEEQESADVLAFIQAELKTWLVGFEDELRREMHPRPRLIVPDPPLLVRPS